MVERGQHLGFSLEACQALCVFNEVRRQEFDRDLAAKLHVFGPVDLTHPALAELGSDLEVGEGGADHLSVSHL